MAELSLQTLLRETNRLDASDLHLRINLPPMVRIYGAMQPLPGYPPLTGEQVGSLMASACTKEQLARFGEEWNLDFSYKVEGIARFRVNYFRERSTNAAVFRRIPEIIPSLVELGAPKVLVPMCTYPRGLILCTGPTGSGKSSTLAAMLDVVNTTRPGHIVTLEEPIEFVHPNKRSVVSQREVGRDTHSFNEGLVSALRQDPDVILVGEMRDLETISTAITAAETGHLVFATLHTQSAPSTIDRIIDVFPEQQQSQIRTQLAFVLKAVICQTLLPRADGKGRIAAHEVLMVNTPVAALIKEQGKTQSIYTAMQSHAKIGMQTMDKSLAWLVQHDLIAEEEARAVAERQQDSEFQTYMDHFRSGQAVILPGPVSWQDLPQEMAPAELRAATTTVMAPIPPLPGEDTDAFDMRG